MIKRCFITLWTAFFRM